jgi:hypothetical protein
VSGKILVTGNPCSGTTFMIGLLHRLGHDCGFSDEEVDATTKGLEWIQNKSNDDRRRLRKIWRENREDPTPPAIKMPFNQTQRDTHQTVEFIESYGWELDAVIVMMRPLDKIKERWPKAKLPHMCRQLTLFMTAAAEKEWPIILASFPEVVDDAEYCHRVLGDLAPPFEEFYPIWEKHCRPEEVHLR